MELFLNAFVIMFAFHCQENIMLIMNVHSSNDNQNVLCCKQIKCNINCFWTFTPFLFSCNQRQDLLSGSALLSSHLQFVVEQQKQLPILWQTLLYNICTQNNIIKLQKEIACSDLLVAQILCIFTQRQILRSTYRGCFIKAVLQHHLCHWTMVQTLQAERAFKC